MKVDVFKGDEFDQFKMEVIATLEAKKDADIVHDIVTDVEKFESILRNVFHNYQSEAIKNAKEIENKMVLSQEELHDLWDGAYIDDMNEKIEEVIRRLEMPM